MDECRHGLIATVCAVCCRAAENAESMSEASARTAEAPRELVVAGGTVPR
jgi:hypothetical protein